MLRELNIQIPQYILDEIELYLWKKENGNSGCATFDNIIALIGLAVLNERISKEQAQRLREKMYELK